jgi:hypothetical protein
MSVCWCRIRVSCILNAESGEERERTKTKKIEVDEIIHGNAFKPVFGNPTLILGG